MTHCVINPTAPSPTHSPHSLSFAIQIPFLHITFQIYSFQIIPITFASAYCELSPYIPIYPLPTSSLAVFAAPLFGAFLQNFALQTPHALRTFHPLIPLPIFTRIPLSAYPLFYPLSAPGYSLPASCLLFSLTLHLSSALSAICYLPSAILRPPSHLPPCPPARPHI